MEFRKYNSKSARKYRDFSAVLLKTSTTILLFCDFQTVSICRTTTPSACMRIISPREFVDVVVMKQYEDGTMLSAGKALVS